MNLAASIGTALACIGIAVPVMAEYEVENHLAAMTGLDPFIAIGITVTTIAGVGWMSGPLVGNTVFGIWKRNLRGEITRVRGPDSRILAGLVILPKKNQLADLMTTERKGLLCPYQEIPS